VLGPGDSVPDAQVWTAPREESRPLRQVLGAGYAFLCFYLWDWSLLRNGHDAEPRFQSIEGLAAANITGQFGPLPAVGGLAAVTARRGRWQREVRVLRLMPIEPIGGGSDEDRRHPSDL
jgi:hypothetical protein